MTGIHLNFALAVAAPELPDLARGAGGKGPGSASMLAIVLMAVLTVVLFVVLWAVFIRKPAKAAERGRLVDATSRSSGEGSGGRRRRRKKERRGRNPTLAETGGLPGRRDLDDPACEP